MKIMSEKKAYMCIGKRQLKALNEKMKTNGPFAIVVDVKIIMDKSSEVNGEKLLMLDI